jgi:phospholipid transport system substrate-binding protein
VREPALLQKEVDELLDYKALAETSLGGPARYASKCEPALRRVRGPARPPHPRELPQADPDRQEVRPRLRRRGAEAPRHPRHHQRPLSRDGKPEVVEVVYVMHQTPEGWKVEDIITDGVSLAKNYKFEFNKILKDKGIDELISRLEARSPSLPRAPRPAKK